MSDISSPVSFGLQGDHMVVGFTTTYAISAYHHTNVVSSNFDQGEVYNIM
jgi:hypothetical protein